MGQLRRWRHPGVDRRLGHRLHVARGALDAASGAERQLASGDRNPDDPDLQTFNPLFPRGNYFSELALLGPRNFYNVHPFLTVNPRDDLSLTADFDFFWRLETEDGIYNPGGQLLCSGAGSDAHHVGNELSLNATWQINPHVSRRLSTRTSSPDASWITRSSCASTKKARSRRWSARHPCCRWASATSKASPTITCGTARPPCLPPSTSPVARSSPSAKHAIATRNSWPFSSTSTVTCRPSRRPPRHRQLRHP